MEHRDVPPSGEHDRMWPALLAAGLLLLVLGASLTFLLYS